MKLPEVTLMVHTYFITKIVLTYWEKKNVLVIEKTFGIWGWRPRICKIFEITRTIYSNSERSEQFLVKEWFLACSWRFLISNRLEKLAFKLEKLLGFRNLQEKLENMLSVFVPISFCMFLLRKEYLVRSYLLNYLRP